MITLAQAAAFSIVRHGLGENGVVADGTGAASSVLGLHAQILTSVAMSIAARAPGYDQGRFREEMYRERGLVKVWCMRGTLHVVAAADLPLFVAAVMRPRAAGHREFLARCGLSPGEIDALPRRVGGALAGGPLTRRELHERVPELGRIPFACWGQDVKDLCYLGHVVHAEPLGNEARFAWTEFWLGRALGIPGEEEATAALLRRYLAAYGPASAADFTYWAGFARVGTAQDARRRLGELVADVTVEGCRRPLWMLADDLPLLEEAGPSDRVFVLPRFDPLVLGLKDRGRFVDGGWRDRLYLPGGFVPGTVWSAGRVVGTWDFRRRGSRLTVEVAEFRPLSRAERGAVEARLRGLAPALAADAVELKFGAWSANGAVGGSPVNDGAEPS